MRTVVAFETESRHARDFIRLPWRLYQGDRRWIPPFRMEVERHLKGDHPFKEFVRQRHFLMMEGEEAVGRVSAFVNSRLAIDGAPLGTLGNFECEDRPDVAEALCEQALEWLQEQGVRTVWGPMNGSMWFSYRFMTKGFEDVPFYGEPYNKPYYPSLFEHAGFSVVKRWNSTFSSGNDLAGMVEKSHGRYHRAIEAGYTFRPLDMERFDSDMRVLHRLISTSFAGFLGFHPIEESTFLSMFSGLKTLAIPDLIQFALNPSGEVVGYVCSLPDYPEGVRAMNGESNFWAKLKFVAKRARASRHVTLYLGLAPQETTRRSGVGRALAHLSSKMAHESNVPQVSALMAEDSYARAYSSGLHQGAHEYALYQRSV